MPKRKRFLVLFVLLISIALFFFVLKEDGEIKRDNIEIGYKTNMEETIPNGEATSGYEFTISPGKLSAGKYQFSLYRDNNLSVKKVFTFN